jgi:hypothetical protein
MIYRAKIKNSEIKNFELKISGISVVDVDFGCGRRHPIPNPTSKINRIVTLVGKLSIITN